MYWTIISMTLSLFFSFILVGSQEHVSCVNGCIFTILVIILAFLGLICDSLQRIGAQVKYTGREDKKEKEISDEL